MFEIVAHAVMLSREEGRVQDDAEGDGRVEQHVVHDHVENVLEAEPELVVEAAATTSGTIPVVSGFWK